MRRFFFTFLAVTIATTAAAQKAPVKQDPAEAINPDRTTVLDCLLILGGLNEIDGKRQVVVNAGKANEQVIEAPYEFASGKLRLDLAKNISILSVIQRRVEEARQKLFAEVAKGDVEIKPNTEKGIEYDRRVRQIGEQPCPISELVRIKAADLKLDKNEIRSGALAAIEKILDR
jgi:hypothetical protein